MITSPSLLGSIRWAFEEETLENGLRVIYLPNHRVPLVAVVVYYHVGARDEKPGETGFAHLFEHMMFQASEHVGKNEFFKYIEAWGGSFNGNTTHERTVYYEVLPADQLPLALWLESDRMRSLAVTAEHLQNQIDTVKEERRFRYDNAPYMGAWLAFNEVAYQNFANAHSVIGSMADLDAATLDKVQRFFNRYYRPNNAVLVVAGDFDPGAARAWVKYYFGDIPPGETIRRPDLTEPPLRGPRRLEYPDRLARLPGVLFGYRMPPWGDEHFYAAWLFYAALAEGRGAYLKRRLIHELGWAIEVSGIFDARRGPGMADVLVLHRPDVEGDEVVERVQSMIASYLTDFTVSELERARSVIIDGMVRDWQENLERALSVGESAVLDGDARAYYRDVEALLDLSLQDVIAAAGAIFVPEHRVHAVIRPVQDDTEETDV